MQKPQGDNLKADMLTTGLFFFFSYYENGCKTTCKTTRDMAAHHDET